MVVAGFKKNLWKDRMSKELYKKHRPQKMKEVIGQTDSVAMLKNYTKIDSLPHSLLFIGPSGCGKTTLARILQRELNCGKADYTETNAADFRGVDDIRKIRKTMGLAPMQGKCKIYLLDEAHQLTTAAQNSFLKMLEDTPDHVYFFLATTDPQKLIKTIRTRCCEIKLASLDSESILSLLASVCKKEGTKITEDVADKIAAYSDGSARKALVILDSVILLKTEKEQLANIQKPEEEHAAFEICQKLFGRGATWKDVASLLSKTDADPEGIRYLVLSYATKVLLSGGKQSGRASLVIGEFADNFYDSKKAGLVLACYECMKRE